MTPEQARLVQLGAATVAAHLRGDQEDRDSLFNEFAPDVQRAADAFIYLALVTVQTLRNAPGLTHDVSIASLPRREEQLIPDIPVRWAEAVRLAEAVQRGGDNIQETAAEMDVPEAINSTFSLAISALDTLAAATNPSAAEWAQIFATGAARET